MIDPERIQRLNQKDINRGDYVLYWMQASQRAQGNHALEHAVIRANGLKKPLVVVFGLTESFPEANERHYAFMLEGLVETAQNLKERGILFVLRRASPDRAALELARKALLVVADRGYLRIQKAWRENVAREAPCRVEMVESDVVVPLETASDKEEYGARTLRPKIHRHLARFLRPLRAKPVAVRASGLKLASIDVTEPASLLGRLAVDRTAGPVRAFRGGTSEARRLLARFVRTALARYGEESNDPSLQCISHMSPYLHFGQISPVDVALRVLKCAGKDTRSKDAYIEQLVVRRELSMNFVHYNAGYDSFEALPDWAKRTLKAHGADRRARLYDLRDLEAARTHDVYWNAAMREMLVTGKMHNYMRMYWGKKILEWSPDPEEAFRRVLYLNNKYFLDGRDPNSYAGVAWCFGKHDRPWTERPVFGTVRYMNDAGLKRKFEMEGYLTWVDALRMPS